MIPLLIAILVATYLCAGFYWYTRPDRAIRQAEKEKHEFLIAAALKILNRGWGIQGAPAMNDEFDVPEEPVAPELDDYQIRQMDSEEASRVLAEKEEALTGAARPRSEGSIAKRRRLVGEIEALRRQVGQGIPPKVAQPGDAPYIGTLAPEDTAHLETLRGAN